MFRWEPEGSYCHRFCTAIAPFWSRGGGGHSRVLVVRGCAALTTPFLRPRCPFSRPLLRSISVPMPIKIVEWSRAIAHPARRAGFRCRQPKREAFGGRSVVKAAPETTNSTRWSPLQRPTFSRSRPFQRPPFSRSSRSLAPYFSLRRSTYLPKCKSSAPPGFWYSTKYLEEH